MRSVILCEGSDDLWFLAYYLHKTQGWNTIKDKKWNTTKVATDIGKQKVVYMALPQTDHLLAIKSTDGQANLKTSVEAILTDNIEKSRKAPIHTLIIFRDCDDRTANQLCNEMNDWFPNRIALENNTVCEYVVSDLLKEEFDFTLKILPLIIPFDEAGAIETLLVKAIEECGIDGNYIATHARAYIDDAIKNVTQYLTSQRAITKAKYAAAMAIVDPTHTRDEFQDLMMSTPWEESCTIHEHMERAVKLISGQLELAEV